MEKKRLAMVCAVLVASSVGGCGRRQVVTVQAAPPPTSGGYVVGVATTGVAPDYVTQHMQVRYSQYAPDMVPDSPLYHGFLQQGGEERWQTVLQAGYCYRVIGVGGPTMADLDLWIVDENGNLIAQDTAVDNFPVLGLGANPICPRWTGPFFIRALAYRGYGEYGIQLFRSR